MPINGGNGVNAGHICFSCGKYANKICPYGNHKKTDTTTFKQGPNGTCQYWGPIDNEEEEIVLSKKVDIMEKTASEMTDDELTVSLYRKIKAMDKKNIVHFFDYWDSLFPEEYAKQMVSDKVETKQKDDKKKQMRKNVF